MYNKAPLSPTRMLDILAESGVIERSATTSIQNASAELPRRGAARRQIFTICQNGAPHVQLFMGPNLENLHRRASDFYQACPTVASRPLFFLNREERDFLGLSFAEGQTAEQLYASGALSSQELLCNLLILDDALSRTEQSSTLLAAEQELDSLLTTLRQSGLLSDPDSAFLDSFIVPKLKAELVTAHPATRWTNGDFILRNIIIGPDGPKLIDYEFAGRTHFYLENWARLSRYSLSLPVSVEELVSQRLAERSTAFNFYGLLRQIVLELEVKRVPELNREVANISRQLIPVLDRWRLESGPSLFVSSSSPTYLQAASQAQIQVFYSSSSNFDEAHAVSDTIAEGAWKRIEIPIPVGPGDWQIRLDPVHRTGIVEIASIEVFASEGGNREPISLRSVGTNGTCFAWSTTPSLNLVCYGPDPQLSLPLLTTESSGPVWLAVRMRWEALETGLGRALEHVPLSKISLQRADIKIQELTASLEHERALRSIAEARAEELRAGGEEVAQRFGARRRECELALERERRAGAEIAAALEEQTRSRAQFEKLAHERQRVYDAAAVQSVARIRELTTSLTEERTSRETAERVARNAADQERRIRTLLPELEQTLARLRGQGEIHVHPLAIERRAMEASVERIQQEFEAYFRESIEHRRALEQMFDAAQLRIRSLEQSLSWKITGPVRRAANLLHLSRGGLN